MLPTCLLRACAPGCSLCLQAAFSSLLPVLQENCMNLETLWPGLYMMPATRYFSGTSYQLIRDVPSHARVIFRSCSEAICGKVAACVSFRVSHCYRCEIHTCFWFGRHFIKNFSLLYVREEVLFARNLFFLTLIPSVCWMNPRASIYLFVLAEYKSPTFTMDAFPSFSPSFSLPESQCSSQK